MHLNIDSMAKILLLKDITNILRVCVTMENARETAIVYGFTVVKLQFLSM